MTPAEELLAIEKIKQLKARYFRLMDTKQWEAFGSVFTSEAEIDVRQDAGAEAGQVRGRERIVESIRSAVDAARTVHHGHMPEIEVTGPGTARGTWSMYDYVEWPAGDARRGFHGFGHYSETYRVEDGAWRIATLQLTRIRKDPLG
jgi:3-phenylpropionate/cinnamic acid dioxygenase small subunit